MLFKLRKGLFKNMNHELASQDKLIKATVAMRRTLLWIRKNDISGFRFRVFVYLAALAPV